MSYWDAPTTTTAVESSLQTTNPYGNLTVVDTIPEDMLPLVHTHWYQFPPMNPLWYGLLGFTITILGILSICGNFVVVWVFLNTKTLCSAANTLVVNLAISDFIMMFTMFPPMAYNCFAGTWAFGPLFCEIYGFLGNLCGCVSIYSMVWITLDRYNVIVKGVSSTPMRRRKAALQLFFTWAFSIAWCLFPLFGWNRYVPEGNMTACGTDYLTDDLSSRSYLYAYSVWVFFGPFILIVYCYICIVKAVITHEKQIREQAKKMGIRSLQTKEEQKTSAEIRLAKVALTTVSLWFMAWCPYLIINWSGMFFPFLVTPLFSIWGSLFAKANAVYNPIVYAISHSRYRAALMKKVPCFACQTETLEEIEISQTCEERDRSDKPQESV
uniref:Opsin L9 n=1 Tax=Neogonodactylus oerstedii TaxID=85128 RepID=A0A6H0X1J5_NEOOE|nr:opsin L9 [Neogonodactylus oerstedii]